jgi:hypothetical protein
MVAPGENHEVEQETIHARPRENDNVELLRSDDLEEFDLEH